jgi:hypothetical protein
MLWAGGELRRPEFEIKAHGPGHRAKMRNWVFAHVLRFTQLLALVLFPWQVELDAGLSCVIQLDIHEVLEIGVG